MADRWRAIRPFVILLLVWEVVGRLDLVAGGALPALSEILARLWVDRADYPRHVSATLAASGAGFVIGNAIAVLAGLTFVLVPVTARLARGLNIAIFALPPIVIAPILALTLEGMTPRIVLAALGVYFVTMQATVTGLTQFNTRAAELVRAYGGGWCCALCRFTGRFRRSCRGFGLRPPTRFWAPFWPSLAAAGAGALVFIFWARLDGESRTGSGALAL